MNSRVIELFGTPTGSFPPSGWEKFIAKQHCPYLDRKCLKIRKSDPDVAIGTCTVAHGDARTPVVICPVRFRERQQIFFDCLHLLRSHEPGNEIHAVPEISVPGGGVDFILVSARNGKVKDFAGIEIQTLDTTGTVWPERQRFLASVGMSVPKKDTDSEKPFGMNWKMTAKTILVQLHHKIQTFEHLGKHLSLVIQDQLLDYMEKEFSFGHLHNPAVAGDSVHFHAYALKPKMGEFRLELGSRKSTDVEGVSTALGLQVSAKVELGVIVAALEAKMSDRTRLTIATK